MTSALAGLSLLTGCSTISPHSGNSETTTSVDLRATTLMLNWTPNAHHAGIYHALEQGWYEEAGINLEILEPGEGIGAERAVAEHRVDFGISQAESLLPARAAGMNLQAIATLLPVNDSTLMGISESGLSSDPASMEGLTYGGYGGALETEIMSQLTKCRGGNPDDIEFIEIGNVDYLSGLEQGRFDVTWVFGGWDALRAQAERNDVVLIPLSEHMDCIPNWYTPIIVGNPEAMTRDPKLVVDFLDVTRRGYEAVVVDPVAGAASLLAGAPELEADLVKSSVAYYAPLFTSRGNFGSMDESVWQEFGTFLVNAGMLEDESALEDSWTNAYLTKN